MKGFSWYSSDLTQMLWYLKCVSLSWLSLWFRSLCLSPDAWSALPLLNYVEFIWIYASYLGMGLVAFERKRKARLDFERRWGLSARQTLYILFLWCLRMISLGISWNQINKHQTNEQTSTINVNIIKPRIVLTCFNVLFNVRFNVL